LNGGDKYMIMADFDSYLKTQKKLITAYNNREQWTKMSILNVAHVGKFSSDRTIQQYTEEIWGATPTPIVLNL